MEPNFGKKDPKIENNPFFCPDIDKVPEMADYMAALNKEGNSVGAKITVVAKGMIPGLGEPIFDRLDADLAKAMLSINASKGFEYGSGFAGVEMNGSEHNDDFVVDCMKKIGLAQFLQLLLNAPDVMVLIMRRAGCLQLLVRVS